MYIIIIIIFVLETQEMFCVPSWRGVLSQETSKFEAHW